VDVTGAETAEAHEDRVADRARHADLVQRLAIPACVGPEDVAAVDGVTKHLLEHKRVAFAALLEEVAKLVAQVGLVEDRHDHGLDGMRPESTDLDQLRLAGAPPALE